MKNAKNTLPETVKIAMDACIARFGVPHKDIDSAQEKRPIRIGALLDRVRIQNRKNHEFSIGHHILNSRDFTFQNTKTGDIISLTEKEAAILIYLKNNIRVVSAAELLKNIWGYDGTIETHTLETHIYRLRQKIEAYPSEPEIIVTRDGGYILEG